MSILRFDPFGDPVRQMDRLTNQLLSGTRTPASLPMDVWRSGQDFHVALDLPDVDPSSVDITVERGVVTIQADRQQQYSQSDQVPVAERPQGVFTRQLMLGEGVDQENLEADYRDGVPYLTIPVAEQAQPRRIQVGQRQGSQLEQRLQRAQPERVLRAGLCLPAITTCRRPLAGWRRRVGRSTGQ